MAWTTSHDQMLCREILVTDPFTGTRKSTVARGTKWEEVADNLNKIMTRGRSETATTCFQKSCEKN